MNVDPFVHPIPNKLRSDPELRPFFEYLVRWALDIWLRTGGGEDAVEDNATRESYPWNIDSKKQDNFEISFSTLPIKSFNAVSVSGSYTALPWDWINATNRAEITFPEYPESGAELIIRNGDGSLIGLKGNGRKINGSDSGQIRLKGTSIRFKYFIESNEWFAI